MLTTVTITGADDAVNPEDLGALSREFPFVEWAILISPKRVGTARYPGETWMHALALLAERVPMRRALHLCGRAARETMDGGPGWLVPSYQRVQINGFEVAQMPRFGIREFVGTWDGPAEALVRSRFEHEFILQVRDRESIAAGARVAWALPPGRASLLFDPSGGRGIEAAAPWPRPPHGEVRMGYAGGINPENVCKVLSDLYPIAGSDFWIDLESGARTPDDRFDLARVRTVLERAQPFVGRRDT